MVILLTSLTGYLEKTMMVTFSRAANLRARIHDHLLPECVESFYDVVKNHLKSMYGGMMEVESEAVGEGPLFTVFPIHSPRATFDFQKYWSKKKRAAYLAEATFLQGLLGRTVHEVQPCSHVFHRAATFSPASNSPPGIKTSGLHVPESKVENCMIQYRLGDEIAVGEILKIYDLRKLSGPVLATEDTKLIIRRFIHLEPQHKEKDPFLKWPELEGRLVYSRFHQSLDVIEPSRIISHVAVCPYKSAVIDHPCSIIWPLDRVSTLPFI